MRDTAAMDDLDGRRDVKPDQRADQFIRLREVIEQPSIALEVLSNEPAQLCCDHRFPPRLLASKAGNDASAKETASSSALMSRSVIVLYVPTPQMFSYWQAAACPRAARKSATYRSPRSPILAALVPSVGTMMLQIKSLVREQVPMNARASEHRSRIPASHRRARKFERHNDCASLHQ